jgi:hypothetical protein
MPEQYYPVGCNSLCDLTDEEKFPVQEPLEKPKPCNTPLFMGVFIIFQDCG